MNSNWRNLIARRDLIRELVRSELKATTAETRLGWFWWLLDPLIMMAIYWIFIVILFGRDKYEAYPIFIGCALLAFKHFSICASQSVKVLRSKQSLIKAVPFPTMALPLSKVASHFMYFLFGFAVLLLAAAVAGRTISPTLVQIIPLMILQCGVVAGSTLLLAVLGVIIRDLETFVSHALRVMFYLSPGIYGLDMVRERAENWDPAMGSDTVVMLYMLNPFAILFTGYRGAVYEPQWLEPWMWAVLTVEAVVLLAAGYLVYQHFDRRVIKFL